MGHTILVTTSVANGAHGLVMAGDFDSAFVTTGITFGSAAGGGIGILAQGHGQKITVAGALVGSTGARFVGDLGRLTITTTGLVQGPSQGLVIDGATCFVQNAGTITGSRAIYSFGSVTLLNSGEITGEFEGVACSGDLILTNTGMIAGLERALDLLGRLDMQNMGTIVGNIASVDQDDRVINSGQISSAVFLNGGSDLVDTTGGRIFGLVDLGAGNDQFVGSSFTDKVHGKAGNDDLLGAGGDDIFYAENLDGSDDIDGGTGLDSYDASSATLAAAINLTTGAARIGRALDQLTGIERASGGAGRDVLTGSAGDNNLYGNASNDRVLGSGGNDRLYGGIGADSVAGGSGNDKVLGGEGLDTLLGEDGDDVIMGNYDVDVMTGGTGFDRFVWRDFEEFIGVSGGTERITDFTKGEDVIDLLGMDARTTLGDQAFTFIGTGTITAFGQLNYRTTATTTIIAIGFNTPNAFDVITLTGVHALTSADFLL